MPFAIVRNDVTRMAVDAIVNSTGPLSRLGGADAAIHRAAGPELRRSCRRLGGCRPGQPLMTPAFDLPCRYVIHTIAPAWQGGKAGEEQQLRACYRDAMQLAVENGLESIAFPLISSGLFAFPREKALCVAMDAIRDFVLQNDLMVYLVVYDFASFRISEKLHKNIIQYIDDRYVEEHGGAPEMGVPLLANAPVFDWDELPEPQADEADEPWPEKQQMAFFTTAAKTARPLPAMDEPETWRPAAREAEPAIGMSGAAYGDEDADELSGDFQTCPAESMPAACEPEADWQAALTGLLREPDESFTQRLLRLIGESGMTDPECYRRANVDRRVFSKIRSNIHYQPSKQTAVAFAVALHLSLQKTEELLRTAGLALSRSSHFDLIVSYFIEQGIYDVLTINEALYAFDQPLLGIRS